ncbi:MAG: hypothetical protein K940chlam1_00245 [Candidatus Anoxychlamydiales bacterium]|nr:hypothetical protein [Candidatus Anoxychlamydiales bacterium]NGX35693.1 hypothetical protein [Candidatus Anoxychlamydiales bacterium]
MKKIIFFFCLLFVLPVFSNFHQFFAEVENSGIYFQIKIRPFENFYDSEETNIISVEVQKPTQFDEGKILFEVVDYPIEDLSSNSNIINFKRGYNLPIGTYSLIVNEVDYGFLYIFEDEVYFDPINCL